MPVSRPASIAAARQHAGQDTGAARLDICEHARAKCGVSPSQQKVGLSASDRLTKGDKGEKKRGRERRGESNSADAAILHGQNDLSNTSNPIAFVQPEDRSKELRAVVGLCHHDITVTATHCLAAHAVAGLPPSRLFSPSSPHVDILTPHSPLLHAAGALQPCPVRADLAGVPNSELILQRAADALRCLGRRRKFYVCDSEVRAIAVPRRPTCASSSGSAATSLSA